MICSFVFGVKKSRCFSGMEGWVHAETRRCPDQPEDWTADVRPSTSSGSGLFFVPRTMPLILSSSKDDRAVLQRPSRAPRNKLFVFRKLDRRVKPGDDDRRAWRRGGRCPLPLWAGSAEGGEGEQEGDLDSDGAGDEGSDRGAL